MTDATNDTRETNDAKSPVPGAPPSAPSGSSEPRPASMAQMGWVLLAVAVFAVLLFLALGPAWGRLFPSAD